MAVFCVRADDCDYPFSLFGVICERSCAADYVVIIVRGDCEYCHSVLFVLWLFKDLRLIVKIGFRKVAFFA